MSVQVKQEKEITYWEYTPDYDKALLYLATFPNGRLKEQNLEKMQFTNYERVSSTMDKNDASIKKDKILVVDNGSLQYSGSSKGQWLHQTISNYEYYVGVRNKKTEKFSFFLSTVVHCNPVLDESNVSNALEEKSFKEKIDELSTGYGSKRKRKAVESRMRHIVNEDGNVESITTVIEEAVMKIEEEDKAAEKKPKLELESAIPPQNKAATSIEYVYNLNDIIDETEYGILDDPSEDFRNATLGQIRQWKTNGTYGAFVCHVLEVYYGSISAHKAKLLLYFHYLVLISKLGYKEFRKKKDPLPGIPSEIKKHLMDKYVISTTDDRGNINKSIPPKMRDKIMAYSMVLALLINSYSVDSACLLRDYKTTIQKLSKVAYALGCRISSKKNEDSVAKIVELKLPLFVPNDKPFSGRKGKK